MGGEGGELKGRELVRNLKKKAALDARVWIILIWLTTGISGELSWNTEMNFGSHKARGTSWPAEELLASQEGLSPV